MEEDIQNYSPTVLFRGTPCSFPKGRRFAALPSKIIIDKQEIYRLKTG